MQEEWSGSASVLQVIFSQSSHDIGAELPSSVYSSSGELTGAGADKAPTPSPDDGANQFSSDSFPRVFKEFDFLEAEHDSVVCTLAAYSSCLA